MTDLPLCRAFVTRYSVLRTRNSVLSFPQILFCISQIIPGIPHDRFLIFLIELATEFAGRSHPERAGFDHCSLGDESAGSDNRSRANFCAVQNNRSHADEAAVFYGAAVQRDGMAHGDIFAEVDAVLLLHAVEHAAILHVGMRADADFVNVAAQHGIHPDGGVLAENHVADDLGGGIDIASRWNGWRDAFEWSNHF
jgi:hypothetical protein